MPLAILDFGTNTFNLLIAEATGKGFKVLYDGKQGVKLGKGGIHKNIISEEAKERGFLAISQHMKTIREYGVNEIHAFGTSAMRNAENGKSFASEIKEKFGFDTHIISGETEASLIFDGIKASVEMDENPVMILDIGGGSNEFIICNASGILWKHSFELGMARIIERFTISDPILSDEIKEIEAYFEKELKLLLEKTDYYKPNMLIGASGSFDTLAALASHEFHSGRLTPSTSFDLEPEKFKILFEKLLNSTTAERLVMPGMEAVRVEMIVPAVIFINFVFSACKLKEMKQSGYALKEGAMSRLSKGENPFNWN